MFLASVIFEIWQ